MKQVEITDFNLTGREKDILDILWKAEKGMIASEIVKVREDLTINTVQAVLKKLLKRNLIKVDQIVYSGTVLSRSYMPTMDESEFETRLIEARIMGLKRFHISPLRFALGFVGKLDEKLSDEETEEIIAQIRKQKEK